MYTERYEELKQQQLKSILNSEQYGHIMNEIAVTLSNQAKSAPNEATVSSRFDMELSTLFKTVFSPLGYNYLPIKEETVNTEVHISKGKADMSVGSLIIEYKHHKKLKTEKQKVSAIEQAENYLNGFQKEGINKQVAYVTDGVKGCFISQRKTEMCIEPFEALSGKTIDRLTKIIIGLSQKALTGENLVKDFCNSEGVDNSISNRLAKSLFSVMKNNIDGKTRMLFEEWQELFKLSHDDQSQQTAIIERKAALENYLEVNFEGKFEEYYALFALQTTYAILVKIVAFKVVSNVKYHDDLIRFDDMAKAEDETLCDIMCELEDGAIFRDYGIHNLLEGDFFSWYSNSKQWNHEIANVVREVFAVLVRYTNNKALESSAKAHDFFKDLYIEMMPQEVRHSLGEYYTKKWLAKQVVNEAVSYSSVESWRGIDPCCGSGTFLTVMIEKILEEKSNQLKKSELLKEIISRVYGIDLNPVTVLTARVNYFLNIAELIEDSDEIEIPVYLGDASYVPKTVLVDGVECLEYSISTKIRPISITLPKSIVSDPEKFSRTMTEIELDIKNKDKKNILDKLTMMANKKDLIDSVVDGIENLAEDLVYLEEREWNGIWARIITNYLTTGNIGKFDIIVGNPPWVDWKNLPSGYREKIKGLCISRKLFSGEGMTGGINLNICALISNVVAQNWMSRKGIMAFLMPETLLFQPTYEGYRNFYLDNEERMYFFKITDWTKAGHPFKPVTQKFLTYFISNRVQDYYKSIPVDSYIIKKGKQCYKYEDIDIKEFFDINNKYVAQFNAKNTIFTYVDKPEDGEKYLHIAGDNNYVGREGVEVYPQELLIFTADEKFKESEEYITLKNIQNPKSKFKVAQKPQMLEKKYLKPLVKGIQVKRFHVDESKLLVPFPYDRDYSTRIPLGKKELLDTAPKLLRFYQRSKKVFKSQNTYSDKLINNDDAEFYALARVGEYCFAENYVVYRDNSKWGAAVVTKMKTPWGEEKVPVFQNHAPIICQDIEGEYISNDEAHYICAILNTPLVGQYIVKSSDSRSYPVRPRITLPKFNSNDNLHQKMVELSNKAHYYYDNSVEMKKIDVELDDTYMKICMQ